MFAFTAIVVMLLAAWTGLGLAIGPTWWMTGVAVLIGVVTGAVIGYCYILHREYRDRVRALEQFDAAIAKVWERPS